MKFDKDGNILDFEIGDTYQEIEIPCLQAGGVCQ